MVVQDTLDKLKHFFTVSLWQEDLSKVNPVRRWLTELLRVCYVMIRELATGELNLRAMSLVFTTLLSLVPLIAVAFSVLKAFGVHNQIEPFLLGFMEPLGSRGEELTENIIGFVENIKVGVLGSVGLAMLFYTIISLVQKIESAFNFVWRVKRPRSLARRFTDYFSVMMIGPVLVFTALGVGASVLNHNVMVQLQSIEPFGTVLIFISKMVPYVMIILAFTFLYTFIPNTRVKLAPALMGGTVAGALWVTLGTIFASFVATSSNYTAIYSGFAILFFFMIWLYLAWFILLTGSQVAFYLQHPKLVQVGGKSFSLSPRLREKEGLWLMTLIARRFCNHETPLSIQELEQETALSNLTLQELISILEAAGMLAEVAGDSVRYIPGQDISTLKVNDILDVLRTAEENVLTQNRSRAEPAIEGLLSKVSSAQSQVLDQLTLRDLALGTQNHG
ncbi:ribonuclease BN [Methylophaga lonarensis MPL]|uniref:Ribonuclease BN n=1 Tax=Methylophaga lonarensis MPL TaxID=1286106 RepID=M7P496_9GAMM|nr:YhjD/YihY/BrkB family envelope integrity protein [Methylophaga lonarensis]EMR14316.1 ribonuclease BN [Methylophaga lonarensis MPL]